MPYEACEVRLLWIVHKQRVDKWTVITAHTCLIFYRMDTNSIEKEFLWRYFLYIFRFHLRKQYESTPRPSLFFFVFFKIQYSVQFWPWAYFIDPILTLSHHLSYKMVFCCKYNGLKKNYVFLEVVGEVTLPNEMNENLPR